METLSTFGLQINSSMSAVQNQPTNPNYLSPVGFRFRIERLPNVNYFCQTVTLPGITAGYVPMSTPLGDVPQTGDKLEYSQLDVRFKVDEDLRNWIEVYDWLQALGRPIDFTQARRFSNAQTPRVGPEGSAASFKSDAVLQILTSHKNVNVSVRFLDCFPIQLSELTFDSSSESIDYLEAVVSFRYRRYDIERLR